MNLYALAENDLAFTLEDSQNGAGREMLLVDTDGNKTALTGSIGDIGYLLDTEGNPIAGRTITACFRMSSFVSGGDYVIPETGWHCRYTDMASHQWDLFVVRAEPDRTLGICRLVLSLNLPTVQVVGESENG